MHLRPVGYDSSTTDVSYSSMATIVIVTTVIVDHAGLGSCIAYAPHSGC